MAASSFAVACLEAVAGPNNARRDALSDMTE